jgi:uncharacterized protein (DUF111 family)
VGQVADAVLLECVIDDLSGELLGRLAELLRDAGSLDVWMTPLFMKKGRPGVQLSVLAPAGREDAFLDLLFLEGSTFGARLQPVTRAVLERDWVSVRVDGEDLQVKVGRWRGRIVTLAPEYVEAAAAAGRLGRPLKDVYAEAVAAARRHVDDR